jgi:protein phosphatase
MADYFIKVGKQSAQGLRPNNEDRFVADEKQRLFLVADGMGGQESGEKASGLAAEIIPRALQKNLDAKESTPEAVRHALDEANQAIIHAGRNQAAGRRMGTTAVLAVCHDDQYYIASLGDSRAILVRNGKVEQLTVDHTVADALERNGTLTREQARQSPWKNVLYKFLGCAEMNEGPDVRPLEPKAGDRLVLGSDGLTNFVTDEDYIQGAGTYVDPQEWADHLVKIALDRGSKDNVTCVVVAFDQERH